MGAAFKDVEAPKRLPPMPKNWTHAEVEQLPAIIASLNALYAHDTHKLYKLSEALFNSTPYNAYKYIDYLKAIVANNTKEIV